MRVRPRKAEQAALRESRAILRLTVLAALAKAVSVEVEQLSEVNMESVSCSLNRAESVRRERRT
jgi:energy-converting hydrogenase A subunit M